METRDAWPRALRLYCTPCHYGPGREGIVIERGHSIRAPTSPTAPTTNARRSSSRPSARPHECRPTHRRCPCKTAGHRELARPPAPRREMKRPTTSTTTGRDDGVPLHDPGGNVGRTPDVGGPRCRRRSQSRSLATSPTASPSRFSYLGLFGRVVHYGARTTSFVLLAAPRQPAGASPCFAPRSSSPPHGPWCRSSSPERANTDLCRGRRSRRRALRAFARARRARRPRMRPDLAPRHGAAAGHAKAGAAAPQAATVSITPPSTRPARSRKRFVPVADFLAIAAVITLLVLMRCAALLRIDEPDKTASQPGR